MSSKKNKSRRVFLGKMLGVATAATLPVAKMSAAGAAAAEMDAQDSWLDEINGAHKCMFDFPAHKNGAGLVHIYNYLTTYQAAYGVDASEVSTIGTFYSVGKNSSIGMAFTDEMWAKYKFGEYLELDDPQTGKPAVRNLFYKTLDGDAL
ncbi:MAG: hypothetical protein ACR2QR_07390, partial [Woeseiaceae bacterium]